MSDSVLLSHVLSVLIPESLLSFKLVKHSSYIELHLEDFVDKIPKELQDCQTVVLDGFTNTRV